MATDFKDFSKLNKNVKNNITCLKRGKKEQICFKYEER